MSSSFTNWSILDNLPIVYVIHQKLDFFFPALSFFLKFMVGGWEEWVGRSFLLYTIVWCSFKSQISSFIRLEHLDVMVVIVENE